MAKKFVSDSSNIWKLFPMLVPLDYSGLRYDGFISVLGKDFRLKIDLSKSRKSEEALIQGDLSMMNIIHNDMDVLKQRLKESKDLQSFLCELVSIMESRMDKAKPDSQIMKSPAFFTTLLNDLETIGWNNISSLDEDLSTVSLKVSDEESREHVLTVKLTAEYPKVPPKFIYALPKMIELLWEEKAGLKGIAQQFEMELKSFQKFWNEMDNIRENSWILEPENPLRSDTSLRLALGDGASIVFTVDSTQPRDPPVWQLLGSKKVIGPIINKLEVTFQNWNENISVIENWKAVLQMELPSPKNTKREEIQVECGICYAYKLEDKFPDRICDYVKCKKVYHSICLAEWLRNLPSSRHTFNTISGECLYCTNPISCQI